MRNLPRWPFRTASGYWAASTVPKGKVYKGAQQWEWKDWGTEDEKNLGRRGYHSCGPMKQLYGIPTLASHRNLGGRRQPWPYWYLLNQFIGIERYFSALMIPSLSETFPSLRQQWEDEWHDQQLLSFCLPTIPSRSLASCPARVINNPGLPRLRILVEWGTFLLKSWGSSWANNCIVHLTFYLFSPYFLPLPTPR